jgi:hypothetical protein
VGGISSFWPPVVLKKRAGFRSRIDCVFLVIGLGRTQFSGKKNAAVT